MKLLERVKAIAPLLKSKKVFIPTIGVLVVVAGLAVMNAEYTVAFQNGKFSFDQKSKQQKSEELATVPTVQAGDQKTGEKSETKEKKPNSTAPSTDDSQPIKYSTSSDPRSTAYSTTPPKPNPRSVDIRITRPHQVAVGTLIAYNPTKDESKVYYGGDLVFSPAAVTIRKSQATKSQNITASTPGGAIADGMPGMPWYITSGAAFAAFDSNAYTGPGTSWILFLDLYYPFPAVGTYQVHVATTHNRSDNTALQYDGFITVVITE